MGKGQSLQWCWDNCTTTHKMMKNGPLNLTLYTKLTQWIKYLNIRSEIIKPFEENRWYVP